ncbi:hypothetical protein ACIKT0_18390, partial [Hansschlegelia beijingensis]
MAVAVRLSPGPRRWLMLRPEDASESGAPAGADALVLDLPATNLSPAEARARLALISRASPAPLYARIPPLETDEAEADLAAAAEARLQSVSCGSTGYAFEDHAEPETSSCLPPPPKT